MNWVRHGDHTFDWSYPIAFIWGLLVVASLAGWGRILSYFLLSAPEREEIGWGLAGAWGMAAFLIISGPMLMLSIFSVNFVLLFLIGGWLSLSAWICFNGKRQKAWKGPPTFGLKLAFILLGVLVILTYAGAVAAREYNQYDDLAAYFYLNKKALDTGTFYDPFSYRMLGALGGQLTLSSFILGFLPWKYANILDFGIAGLIVFAMSQQFVRGQDRAAWKARLFLFGLALMYPVPHTNTASESTGVALFMALFCSFDLVASQRIQGWRAAILLAGVAVAAATLRCHNVFMIGLLGMGFVTWRFWEGALDRRQLIRESMQQLIMILVFIAPWLVVTYRSGRTILYPIFKGNHSPDFEIFNSHLSFGETIQYIAGFFESTWYIYLFLPICFLLPGSRRNFILLSAGLILLLSVAFVSQLTTGTAMWFHIYRYLVPIGLGFGLYTCGIVVKQFLEIPPDARDRFSALLSKFALIAGIGVMVFLGAEYIIISIINVNAIYWAINPKNQAWCDYIGPFHSTDAEKEYRLAFEKIPAGSKMFVAVDYPFLIDTRTYPTFSADVVGAASPPPGLPYFKGPEPVKKYLLDQGFSYIAYVPFENSQFLDGRDTALRELSVPGQFFQVVGKYKWDFLNNIDALAASNKIIYYGYTIRIISLKD